MRVFPGVEKRNYEDSQNIWVALRMLIPIEIGDPPPGSPISIGITPVTLPDQSMNVHHHRRGAVESVLSFVEKQQDKRQKKIDEENRRLEEEKRRQEERRKEIIDQIFNEKYRKRNLIIFGAVAILILVTSTMVATRETPSHEGEARTPGGSSYHQGRDYKDAVSDFEDNGFINIETEELEDLTHIPHPKVAGLGNIG